MEEVIETQYHTVSHRCHECKKSFSGLWAVEDLKSLAEDTHLYRCQECDKVFRTLEEVKTKIETEKHTKPHLNKIFSSPSATLDSPIPAPTVPFAFVPVEKEPPRSGDDILEEAKPREGQDPIGSSILRSILVEGQTAESESNSPPNDSITCLLCRQKLPTKGSLVKHLETEHGTINCQICSKNVKTKVGLARHLATVHGIKRFPCHWCHEQYSIKINLERHIERQHWLVIEHSYAMIPPLDIAELGFLRGISHPAKLKNNSKKYACMRSSSILVKHSGSIHQKSLLKISNNHPRDTPNSIKRPRTAYLLWLRAEKGKIKQNLETSIDLRRRWKLLAKSERKPFIREARRLRILHQKKYPQYNYRVKHGEQVAAAGQNTQKGQDPSKTYSCPLCDEKFTLKWILKQHTFNCHKKVTLRTLTAESNSVKERAVAKVISPVKATNVVMPRLLPKVADVEDKSQGKVESMEENPSRKEVQTDTPKIESKAFSNYLYFCLACEGCENIECEHLDHPRRPLTELEAVKEHMAETGHAKFQPVANFLKSLSVKLSDIMWSS